MPELPEVETVVRMLRPRLEGRMLTGVHVGPRRLRVPWQRRWNARLIGRRLAHVQRRGKWIVIDLALPESGDALLVHLGMTGRLILAEVGAPTAPHTHAVFHLDDGKQELRFLDPRRFGLIRYLAAPERARLQSTAALGPEPWQLTTANLAAQLARTRRCLKAVLLDQRVLAGVGNIYADEALFEARLHPGRIARTLARQEVERLRCAVVRVLERAIRKHGSTILTFYYGDDEHGEYQNEFRVYGRQDQPCRRCRTPIAATRLAGRSTHYCPQCQPLP
jgi:formamidopyrimidine-DNA glycosylase